MDGGPREAAAPDGADVEVDARGGLDAATADAPDIRSCPASGQTTLASAESLPTGIAVDALRVYWANAGSDCSSGQIRAMPKGGGPIVTLADGPSNPRAQHGGGRVEMRLRGATPKSPRRGRG